MAYSTLNIQYPSAGWWRESLEKRPPQPICLCSDKVNVVSNSYKIGSLDGAVMRLRQSSTNGVREDEIFSTRYLTTPTPLRSDLLCFEDLLAPFGIHLSRVTEVDKERVQTAIRSTVMMSSGVVAHLTANLCALLSVALPILEETRSTTHSRSFQSQRETR